MTTTTPNVRLDGRTAITGAASGIGRSAARGIAGSGVAVACVDLPGPGLDVPAEEMPLTQWQRVVDVDLLVDGGFTCW